MNRGRCRTGFWLLVVAACGQTAALQAEDKLGYNEDIRPILADACFNCHGPDSASRKGDLRLDQRDAAIDMSAITPGDPDSSELIRRILSDDPDEVMPPPETKKTLSDHDKALLTRWIEEGAEYQLHWSFLPPTPPALPEVSNPGWVQNPIDQFVLARLDKEKLTPAPEADRRTLARRASLDLTGLPPDPALVEKFVQDDSPNAYETLVDTLLESPAWGEHRARYWLDYARYADTHGIHFDNFREMWSYRDWVIDAFNANMPYDQFTIESLAGDLLPNATLEQKIASGFNRCNMTTNEGGVIPEEYLVLYTRDRVETTSQIWMGLTAGCAVCHTHKFDPISHQEFYELAAFFNNTTQNAMDGNIKDTPPIVVVPKDEDRARWDELVPIVADARNQVRQRRDNSAQEFANWLASVTPEDLRSEVPKAGLVVHVPLTQEGATTPGAVQGEVRELAVSEQTVWQPDGKTGAQCAEVGAKGIAVIEDAGDFEFDQPFSAAAWIKVNANDGNGAIVGRLKDEDANLTGWDLFIERRRVGMHISTRWNYDAIRLLTKDQIPAKEWTHVAFSYDGSGRASGIKLFVNGQPQEFAVHVDRLERNSIRTPAPLAIGQRSKGGIATGTQINDVRVYDRQLSEDEAANFGRKQIIAGLLAKPADARDDKETQTLLDWWLATVDPVFMSAQARLKVLEQEEAGLKMRGTVAHVMNEKMEPATAYVLSRGEYDQRLEQVTPNTLAVLPEFPEALPRNRLGFAHWLLMPEQPLTARVTVNRCWQELFGAGIVKTSGDFGIMGELPSHPELLDWLALEFVKSGWDLKQLYKLMAMSATYQQSAAATPEKIERDPANRLLARGPRFRMDAEMVRDVALAASGELVEKIGGPSVKPYQPPGVWEAIAMNVSNTANYKRGTGDDLYRRSIYTFVKRMAPPASMDIFNAPNREICTVVRERTNTPLQALATMNDEQFIEAARRLAELALSTPDAGKDERINLMSARLISRDLRPEEMQVVHQSLEGLSAYYAGHPDDAKQLIEVGESQADASLDATELAAWTMLANQLMNLDEVLNK